jgi:hypothetical protein
LAAKKMKRNGFIALVLGVAILGLVSCSRGQPDGPGQFVSLLRLVNYDYEPFDSPVALADAASLVVVGHIESVESGRRLEIGQQATLIVSIDRVVRGTPAGDPIRVEIPTSGHAQVTDLNAVLPTGRVLLFLDDRSRVPPVAGGGMYAPYPQGFILEDGSRFVGGIEDLGTADPSWTTAQSLDELVDSLESAASNS